MGKALYREYRPKRLSEVLGQDHVTKTLANAIKSGKVSHAYLLTGPRGTGKTTIARILAHEINQLDYVDDSAHLDIIEIDAASNRRIDEIRELRERVHTAPTSVKYKVYIIDEVHMLTKEAFNALLKTLEEPPAHAIFILATTEVHKLPETIISRTQRFSLKPATKQHVIDLLKQIAKKEGFAVSDEALDIIAEASNGGFRDSLSLLDQARHASDNITADDAYNVLGIAPSTAIARLEESLTRSPADIVATLQDLRSSGYQSGQLAKQLGQALRVRILSTQPGETHNWLQLLHELLEVPYAKDIDAKLELVLLGFHLRQSPQASPQSAQHRSPAVPTLSKAVDQPVAKPEQQAPQPEPTQESSPLASAPAAERPTTEAVQKPGPIKPVDVKPLSVEVWQDILNKIKQKYNTLYGVIRMAEPEISDDTLTLKFGFAFHQKRINEAKNKQILADIIKEVTGRDYPINSTVDKHASPPPAIAPLSPAPTAASEPSTTNPNLDAISNIFGGAEVLES